MPPVPVIQRPRKIALGKKFPMIICLCGSTRFKALFELEAARLADKGHIVLTPSIYHHVGPKLNPKETDTPYPSLNQQEEEAQNELHKAKIMLADMVMVINFDQYIGPSTQAQIDFAKHQKKPITFLEPQLVKQNEKKKV